MVKHCKVETVVHVVHLVRLGWSRLCAYHCRAVSFSFLSQLADDLRQLPPTEVLLSAVDEHLSDVSVWLLQLVLDEFCQLALVLTQRRVELQLVSVVEEVVCLLGGHAKLGRNEFPNSLQDVLALLLDRVQHIDHWLVQFLCEVRFQHLLEQYVLHCYIHFHWSEWFLIEPDYRVDWDNIIINEHIHKKSKSCLVNILPDSPKGLHYL